VRTTLLETSGVTDAGVDMDGQVAHIVPGDEFDAEAAIAALKDAGYRAEIQP